MAERVSAMSARSAAFDRVWPPALGLASRAVLQPLFGTRHLSVARWLPRYWGWSDEQRGAWQQRQLARVLGHAVTRVPYYRAAGCDPADLTTFPLVDKATMRNDVDRFRSERNWDRTVTKRTSGSTGDPWTYQLDRRAFTHMYGAQLAVFERHGYRYGQRRLYLGAPTAFGLERASGVKRIRHRLERVDASMTGLDINRPHSVVRAVRAADADAAMWYGYAGTIAAIGEAVVDEHLPVSGPRLIVTMAEKLQPGDRRTLETAFPSSAIVEEYGCNDGGVLAHSCPAGRLHLADSLSIVEVLDGHRRCEPGEEGDVIVTNLHARSMPFIRYRVGDRAVVGPTRCSCGEPGPTIDEITGRSGDRLELANGTILAPTAFTHCLRNMGDVRRWQVLQWSDRAVELRLDVTDTFDDHDRAALTGYVERMIGASIELSVTTTRPLLRTAGGKHRVIVGPGDLHVHDRPRELVGR